MKVTITNKTKIPKGYKLPRKEKKRFKKGIHDVSFNQVKTKSEQLWLFHVLYNSYKMKTHNLKSYKGSTEIFLED